MRNVRRQHEDGALGAGAGQAPFRRRPRGYFGGVMPYVLILR